MHRFDITLKLLLQGPSAALLRQLGGGTVVRWLEVEALRVEERHMDLLCQLADGSLLHIELQSSNDPDMPLRMAEYALAVKRRYGRMPRQIVLYVGRAPMRMPDVLAEGGMAFRYELVDFRELDGEELLDSPDVGDNVLAVLARLRDGKAAVARIVERIRALKDAGRDQAVAQLGILAGLRGLEDEVQEELEKMPIVVDLMENKVFARGYSRAQAAGKAEGRVEGERTLLLRLIRKRFGSVPDWVDERLAGKTTEELELLGLRFLDAQSIADLML